MAAGTAVEDPSAQALKQAALRKSRVLARSAVLINALAVLAAAAAWLAFAFLADHRERRSFFDFELGVGENDSREAVVFISLGKIAATSLYVWSLLIVVRAAWMLKGHKTVSREEWHLTVPLVILLAELLAVSFSDTGFRSFVLNGSRTYCLPVFLPFLALAASTLGPLAFWRARRAERIATAAGAPPWSGKRRWARRCAWLAPSTIILAVLLLPWPLCVYCHLYGYSFHMTLANAMPAFVTETVAGRLEGATNESLVRAHCNMLTHGRVSLARLERHLLGNDEELRSAAFDGMTRSHPLAAFAYAQDYLAGKWPADGISRRDIGFVYGEYGSEEEVRRILGLGYADNSTFLNGVVDALRQNKRREFNRDLETLANAHLKDHNRFNVQSALTVLLTPDEQIQCWIRFHANPDPNLRRQAARGLSLLDASVRAQVALLYSSDPDQNVRRATLLYHYYNRAWVQRLLELLDEPDLAQRRAAVHGLRRALKLPARMHRTPNAHSTQDKSKSIIDGADPDPEQPDEHLDVDFVRAAANQWLSQGSQKN